MMKTKLMFLYTVIIILLIKNYKETRIYRIKRYLNEFTNLL